MKWNEVTRIDVAGRVIVAKDAMVMLCGDEEKPEWPSISCSPGEYILEIHVPVPFCAHRVRLRKADSKPILGNKLGSVDIDNAFVGFVDYESFLAEVRKDVESYEEWTMMQLDDELAINFSGEILFGGEKLVYVKSAEGDGTFPVFELLQDDGQVGIECVFVE